MVLLIVFCANSRYDHQPHDLEKKDMVAGINYVCVLTVLIAICFLVVMD